MLPRLLHKKTSITKNFWETEDKAVMLLFLCVENFDTRKFLNYKRVHLRSFPVLREKNPQKIDASSFLSTKNFRYQKRFNTHNCSLTNYFGTVRQKTLTEFDDILPLNYNIFQYQIFPKTRKGSLTNFLAQWVKKLLTESGDTPILIQKVFSREILKNRRVNLWSFPVLREKISRKTWYAPFYP